MNRTVSSIVLAAALVHLCIAAIVVDTTGPRHLNRLYRVAIDISMICYGDTSNAVGIVGDTEGLILKELRNHFIPVVLVDKPGIEYDSRDNSRSHKVKLFVILLHSRQHFVRLLFNLKNFIWWNDQANFLIVDARPGQCSQNGYYMHVTDMLGVLNVQFVCVYRNRRREAIIIITSNPFVRRAPEAWTYINEYKRTNATPTTFLFARRYRKGGQSCESIDFDKTTKVGGYPLHFVTKIKPSQLQREIVFSKQFEETLGSFFKLIAQSSFNQHRWLIDNIVIALNVSEVISTESTVYDSGIHLIAQHLSSKPEKNSNNFDRIIMPLCQTPMFAVTQHTGHKSQLEKILSVVDRTSRIGMWVVYLITFLFFKFFLGQAVMPAVLNLVRLTCNTGLTRLPKNVAPTIFLAGLFMFVVTLQAIYTGNLATLLTTTIPYPNVQTKEDIVKWGYTVYIEKDTFTKLTADPILDGSVIEIPHLSKWIDYVQRDPLAVCIVNDVRATAGAYLWKLHVSRDPIIHEYIFYFTSGPNLLKRRIEGVLRTLVEAGLHRPTDNLDRLRLRYVDDDEVRQNTDRRVMTFDHLCFAFVILGVGLLCSFVCFIGEIVICKIRLKIAERRDRVRVLSVSGVDAKKCSSFPSLNCRFNFRLLFSNRR